MRGMVCNLILILHCITLSNKTYNMTELPHTPYEGIRTYHNLNFLLYYFQEYTYSIVNLPHTTIMRGVVHNITLTLHLLHLIITYNMTELPHTLMRESEHTIIFIF